MSAVHVYIPCVKWVTYRTHLNSFSPPFPPIFLYLLVLSHLTEMDLSTSYYLLFSLMIHRFLSWENPCDMSAHVPDLCHLTSGTQSQMFACEWLNLPFLMAKQSSIMGRDHTGLPRNCLSPHCWRTGLHPETYLVQFSFLIHGQIVCWRIMQGPLPVAHNRKAQGRKERPLVVRSCPEGEDTKFLCSGTLTSHPFLFSH